jgi:hypothetical protein
MLILSRLGTTMRRLAGLPPATASSVGTAIPALPGAQSSPPPLPAGTPSPIKPSFERSATNSSASITLQVSPAPPLVYTVEPVSGGWPWHRLTVHFVPSPADLGLPTLPSDAFGSNTPAAPSDPSRDIPGHPDWYDHLKEPPLL